MLKKLMIISASMFFVFIAFSFVQYDQLNREGVIVLLYHKVESVESTQNKYSVTKDQFVAQLDYLVENGYQTILPKDIITGKIPDEPSKTVILSFDDGTEDHFLNVYPLLKERGMNGVFFVVTKYIDRPGLMQSWQLKEMHENNMEIGSHGYTHLFLDALSKPEINHQLLSSKNDIENIIGDNVLSIAPPGGWFDNIVVENAKKVGYSALFGCEIGVNDLNEGQYVYKRNEVLGKMTNDEFKGLLTPTEILPYKLNQAIKFIIHDILGSEKYKNIAKTL